MIYQSKSTNIFHFLYFLKYDLFFFNVPQFDNIISVMHVIAVSLIPRSQGNTKEKSTKGYFIHPSSVTNNMNCYFIHDTVVTDLQEHSKTHMPLHKENSLL